MKSYWLASKTSGKYTELITTSKSAINHVIDLGVSWLEIQSFESKEYFLIKHRTS
jgi:hypothetical protein